VYQLYWKPFLSLKTRGSSFPGRAFAGLTEMAYLRVMKGISGFVVTSHDEQRPLHASIDIAVEGKYFCDDVVT